MLEASEVASWLGGPVKPFSVPLHGKLVSGFTSAATFRLAEAEQRVLSNRNDAELRDARLFCGSAERVIASLSLPWKTNVFVYAVPGIKDPMVAELCDTGKRHSNYEPGDNPYLRSRPSLLSTKLAELGYSSSDEFRLGTSTNQQQLYGMLQQIYDRFPFTVYYADRKGLKATFNVKINEENAQWLENQIGAINVEAFEIADPLSMKDYIVQNQTLHLWWD